MSKVLNQELAVVNMAFGSGSESKEGGSFDKYVGIAPFFVLGVNMTMAEMQAKFPDRNYTKEFDYAYNKPDEAKGTFVTFSLQANSEHKDCQGINLTTRASYLIKDEIMYNKDKTKVQVINKYGDTLWLTSDEFKNKTLPDHAIKSNWITTDMRPAMVGEEQLIEFLKAFIGIPNSRNYSQDTGWTPKVGKDLEDAEAGFSLEDIKKIANGDVTPVKDAVKHQPNNQIKFLVGVRTTSDNKEYNEVYSRLPIRYGLTDYKKIDAKVQEVKEAGGLRETNFGVYPYKMTKYEVGMTDFSQSNQSALPANEDPFAGFGG